MDHKNYWLLHFSGIEDVQNALDFYPGILTLEVISSEELIALIQKSIGQLD